MDINDTEAIALYVAAGNPRGDWDAMDDRDRYPWRKMALEGVTVEQQVFGYTFEWPKRLSKAEARERVFGKPAKS